jgi:hypothetical protein
VFPTFALFTSVLAAIHPLDRYRKRSTSPPNDPKLSDRAQRAAALATRAHGRVRCSACLSDVGCFIGSFIIRELIRMHTDVIRLGIISKLDSFNGGSPQQ